MTVCLAMIVRDEEANLPACLSSVWSLVDSAVIVDTGSMDGTVELAQDYATVYEREWVDFGHNRTEMLQLAKGAADWLLLLDADMTVEFHPDLREWLGGDPDPEVAAWMVREEESWGWYRRPLLIRGDLDWRYDGRTHEALDVTERKTRALLGLTIHHHPNHGPEKHTRDLELLRDDFKAGDPRATFYTAQAFRALGRKNQAIITYEARAKMNGWEEEAWYAEYQAALLAEDVDGLVAAFRRRPWRHEPLLAAARIVGEMDSDDILFREPC